LLLEAKNLSVCYGVVKALSDSSFTVGEGEAVAMIGPNGAGKSTAIKAVAGLLDFYNGTIKSGSVHYNGQEITGLSADALANLGIAIVPEGRRTFTSMTVSENLEMGGYLVKKKATRLERIDMVLELFVPLRNLLKRTAGTLSGGEQQMLAIGRALMLAPRLLIADEPSLGLSPNYVEIIEDKMKQINRSGTSILLVEQNVTLALSIAQRAYVFEMGRISYGDSSDNLLHKTDLKNAFLGR